MLRFLAIRNLAVIDRLEVDLGPGLTVLTGETGAGKSMLVEAIDLLVGGRASADLIRTGESTAQVQAVFDLDGAERVVRREITAQGRHRAFIDDALSTTAALRDLGAQLVDLHGQHEHQSLLNPAEHVALLDRFADHAPLGAAVAEAYQAWRSAAGALERTRLGAKEKAARIDWVRFQLQELDAVSPEAGEDEALSAERGLLLNADRLTRLSTEAYASLYDAEDAVLSKLALVWKRVADLAALDPRFEPFVGHRTDVQSRLEDLSLELRDFLADLEASPDRLQQVEDRLAALDRLKAKHGPDLADVVRQHTALREELNALQASDEDAGRLEQAAVAAAVRYRTVAGELSKARNAAGRTLCARLAAALESLAMPNCKVEARVVPAPEDEARWGAGGYDVVEFYLSPNPGEEVRPLARIASGGELSRVMLALRTLGVPEQDGRTLVFDEVDAGIGGTAADAVGQRLRLLADRYQVFCITHLPQIAARGDQHLQIRKQVEQGRTVTIVEALVGEPRVAEVARMIAGEQVTPAVLESALDLLRTRGESETEAKGESESPRKTKAKERRGA
jgi:DNA repair protein RecN (Recombination protein N)